MIAAIGDGLPAGLLPAAVFGFGVAGSAAAPPPVARAFVRLAPDVLCLAPGTLAAARRAGCLPRRGQLIVLPFLKVISPVQKKVDRSFPRS